jgi:hypothetical protein
MHAFVSRRNIDFLALFERWLLGSGQRLSSPTTDDAREEIFRPLVDYLTSHEVSQIRGHGETPSARGLFHSFNKLIRQVKMKLSHSKYILAHVAL